MYYYFRYINRSILHCATPVQASHLVPASYSVPPPKRGSFGFEIPVPKKTTLFLAKTIFYHKHAHHYHTTKPPHHKNHFCALQNPYLPLIVIPLAPLLSCESQEQEQRQHETNLDLPNTSLSGRGLSSQGIAHGAVTTGYNGAKSGTMGNFDFFHMI